MAFGFFEFYLLCFFIGFFYAIVSGVLSGIFGGHHEAGGAEGGAAEAPPDVGVEHPIASDGHDNVVATDAEGGLHLSPISPITIAMFISSFGAAGSILMKLTSLHHIIILGISTASGFGVAGFTIALFSKIFGSAQGSSEAHVEDIIGLEAEVITAIPGEGAGEIAYTARGSRYTAVARSVKNKPIGRSATVVVEKIVGSVAYVSEIEPEKQK